MKSVTIHLHSFVDLITNSSSETFISARDSSVKTVTDLVDNMLQLGGSTLKCADVFKVEIVYAYKKVDDYDDIYMTPAEAAPLFDSGEISEDDNTRDAGYANSSGYTRSAIRVTAKVADDALAKKIAQVLSNLEGLFSYESTYS